MQCERAERASLDSIIDDSPLFNVRLKLGTESRTSSSLAPVELLEGCKLDLRSLRDERHHSNTGLSWEKLFDTIITAPEDVQQDGSISRMKSLASFEVSPRFNRKRHFSFLIVPSDVAGIWRQL